MAAIVANACYWFEMVAIDPSTLVSLQVNFSL